MTWKKVVVGKVIHALRINISGAWGDGSVAKRVHCACRRSKFASKHPCVMVHWPGTQGSGNPTLSSGLGMHRTKACTHT